MNIIFVDKNKELVSLICKVSKTFGWEDILTAKTGDIFKEKGVIVSASNPSFTMGGGLDALIASKFPDVCKKINVKKGNQRIKNIIFTITVGGDLRATEELVSNALRFAFSNTKKNETLLLTGLGTGIGGMDIQDFAYILIQEVMTNFGYRWKFFQEGWKSQHGNDNWDVGKINKVKGEIELCENGYHCSVLIPQAFSYLSTEYIGLVKVGGDSDISSDKEAWQSMSVCKRFILDKTDFVRYAVCGAELVIDLFEKQYPNDDRPRKAIEAAKSFLKASNNDAAGADAARAAAYAADAAARAAAYAADAYAAARAAAYAADAAAVYVAAAAARAAADAADAAAAYAAAAAAGAYAADAYAAAYASIYTKLDKFFILNILLDTQN